MRPSLLQICAYTTHSLLVIIIWVTLWGFLDTALTLIPDKHTVLLIYGLLVLSSAAGLFILLRLGHLPLGTSYHQLCLSSGVAASNNARNDGCSRTRKVLVI